MADTIGTQNAERLARMNELAEAQDDKRASEFDDFDQQAASDASAELDQIHAAQDDEPRRFRIKVNGQEIELTEDELIARAQKVESADRYLQSAAEANRTAQELALSRRDAPPVQVDEDDRALVRAIQMGSEEEAVQAIQKLKSPGPSSMDAVARVVDERLSFQSAVQEFRSQFSDLTADPMLYQLVVNRDAQLAQQNPNQPYHERLTQAGTEIREWHQKLAGGAKAARKAEIVNTPTTAGSRQVVDDDEADDAPESVIADMAKARGQGRPIRH